MKGRDGKTEKILETQEMEHIYEYYDKKGIRLCNRDTPYCTAKPSECGRASVRSVLMQWIDELAGLVAKRHSHMNVTTASVDNLRFLKGAYQRDVVVISGKITYVGNTSMEVRVDSYVEDLDGVTAPINRAYFTMVALDENDKPCTVPRLTLTTDEEREEWEKAKLRKEVRLMRKEVGI